MDQAVEQAEVDSRFYREYAGSYQLGDDPAHIVTLGPFDEYGGRLVFLDLKTLREGVLHPRSDTEFFTGPTVATDSPVDIEVSFSRDANGNVSGLAWQQQGAAPLSGEKLFPHIQEDVEFQSGDITLRGNLTLPPGHGPHPAVVFAHGSGPATRDVGFFNTFFPIYGVAVLSFDKRGAGESTGDWVTASLDELVGDILAGIKFLKGRPEIDHAQIGIHGSSQGGWTGPMAAVRSSDVAFLIVRAGSGVSVLDNVVYEREADCIDLGMTEGETREAMTFIREVLEIASRGEPWERSDELSHSVRHKRWYSLLYPEGRAKNDAWGWYALNGNIDPVDSLRQLRIPVLWFLGELDRNVPSAVSEERIVNALREAGNTDFTVKMLPRANHGFFRCETGLQSEWPTLSHFVPGYWDTMAEWLQERLHAKGAMK